MSTDELIAQLASLSDAEGGVLGNIVVTATLDPATGALGKVAGVKDKFKKAIEDVHIPRITAFAVSTEQADVLNEPGIEDHKSETASPRLLVSDGFNDLVVKLASLRHSRDGVKPYDYRRVLGIYRHIDFVGREWLFERIANILGDEQKDRGFIILSAGPGFGKTGFVLEFIERFKDTGIGTTALGAWHLLRKTQSTWVSAISMVEQLEWRLRDRLGCPLDGTQTKTPVADANAVGILQKAIDEAAQRLAREQRLLLVIDGVDEAFGVNSPARFPEPISLPKGVFVLLTSRPGAHLHGWLYDKADVIDVDHGDDSLRVANRADLYAYLKRELENANKPYGYDETQIDALARRMTGVCEPFGFYIAQWFASEAKNRGRLERWLGGEKLLSEIDRTNLAVLLETAIDHASSATRNEELGQLKDRLTPLSFDADIAYHLPRFTGRQWLLARYENWLSKPVTGNSSKVFRIEGGLGMGKTAIACYLAYATKSSVLGVHLCKSDSATTQNPAQLVLSLAYQIATRMPDYRTHLLRVPCIKNPELLKNQDAGSLWDTLISEPLSGAGKFGLIERQRLAIVIDGLDEATRNGQNQIVELLVDHIQTLPSWVGVVLTGRPDPELTQSLKHYTPQVINGDDPANLEDLRHYIDAWLNDEVQARRLQAHQVPAAASMLLQKSEGAFLYLVQAREESQPSNEDGSSGFDLSNPATLPSGLNELYRRSFKRRFPEVVADPDNPATRWNALAKPLLGYILASPEPLPLDIARELMAWDTDATGNEKQHKAMQALGSLIKRNGNTEKAETCTLAPFHNSVREWLASEASQSYRIFTESSLYPLTVATWKRYLIDNVDDTYAWQVLPELLPRLSVAQQDELLGEPNWDTSQVLYRLADSMERKLRYTEADALWRIQVRLGEKLSQSAPENAGFARALSVSYDKLGNVQKALGNSQRALALYQQSLVIAERLSRSDPGNAQFARDLSVSYDKLGNMHEELGNSLLALTMYEKHMVFSERLCRIAPENTLFALDLGVSYEHLGNMQLSLGNSQAALTLYQQFSEIAERLSQSAPENVLFARELSVSFEKLGDMQQALGNSQAALAMYQRRLGISERLSSNAPENAGFARDLSVSYNKLGNVQKVLGNIQMALGLYQKFNEMAERLSRSAPENAVFARDLTVSIEKLGDMQQGLGNSQAALAMFEQCLGIRERLSSNAPENAQFARDLSVCIGKLGGIQQALGNGQAALAMYQRRLGISERLSSNAPENAQFARDLSVSFEDLGNTLASLGRTDEAKGYYQLYLKIRKDLSARAPEDAQLARDIAVNYWNIASISEGAEQRQWWVKLHAALVSMNERGILTESDKQKLADVKLKLGTE